tara:strand:+ start:2994 stop:3185 length:192 start_codon:yes stop_codon:yes gene_type:complete
MKKCLYCGDEINNNDDFEKIGRKYICVFCYEDEYVSEIYNQEDYLIDDDDDDDDYDCSRSSVG